MWITKAKTVFNQGTTHYINIIKHQNKQHFYNNNVQVKSKKGNLKPAETLKKNMQELKKLENRKSDSPPWNIQTTHRKIWA